MILRVVRHLIRISVYEMPPECQVTKQLISLFGLVAFLWISLPLPLAYAQIEATKAETREEKWKVYGDRFKNTGDATHNFAKILSKSGHNMLRTELLNATEGSGIQLIFTLGPEDLASLLKQISEAQRMPNKFDKLSPEGKTKLMLAKYVVLPKFFYHDDTIRVETLCLNSSFGQGIK